MEIFDLAHNVKTFGFQVKTFPLGIGETFDALMKILPSGENRSFYGVSWFAKDGSILYYALAEEIFEGEEKKYGDYSHVIKKGRYLTEKIKDWRKKTDCIKDVFREIMKDDRIDNSKIDSSKPCVEWYKSEDEMLCMIQI